MLTEAILSATVEAVFGYLLQESGLADRVRVWLGRDLQRLAFQVALTRAYTAFVQRHPDWAATLFDEHFLVHGAAPLLAQTLLRASPATPTAFAAAWADQLTLAPEGRARRIAELTPVAADFLQLLDREVRARPEFQPLYDSRALDALMESNQEIVAHLESLRAELSQALQVASTVTITGKVEGGVVVIGHGTVVQQTDPELVATLRELRQRFEGSAVHNAILDYTAYIQEKTRGFVGRQFVFEAIDNFMRANPRGYYFVRGDPGIGKTALVAQLVKSNGYVHHFNIRGEGINRNDIFLKNVSAQLIATYGLNYDHLPPEASQDSGFLDHLLGEISAQLSPPGRAVIVIDALDEVETLGSSGHKSHLYLPVVLPSHVYVVATMRNVPLPRIEVEHDVLTIEQDSENNSTDIRLYVKQAVGRPGIQAYMAAQGLDEEAFIDHLATKKSQGNFMYLRYVLPEIENGAYKDLELEALPVGLQNYYEDHWRRMRGQDEAAWFEYKLPIIMALTVVKEPISVDLVADFSNVPSRARINSALNDWRQFLYEQTVEYEGQAQKRYRIYHASFHDFIAQKEEVEGERVDRRQAKERIADVLWADLFGE